MTSSSPFPPGSQVAAYLRDSGGDDQDLSVDQQELAVRAWCSDRGLVLSRVFRDFHQSGSTTENRAGFEELIQYFRQKLRPAEAGLVIWKFSRFARNLNDAQFYKADLRRRGFIIHSMQDNIPDGLDGHFFEAALDWMNARFLKDLSEDVRRGLHHNLTQFGAVPGVPPRGFKRELITVGSRLDGRPHQVSKWVPDPETWELCKTAWEMRARGASYREINARCHLFKSLTGYPTFFTNRIYLGELRYGSAILPHYTAPMIDEKTWQTVQSIASMSMRSKGRPPGIIERHPRRLNSRYILSGLLFCARCGSPLNGDVVRPKKKSPNFYYSCNGRRKHNDCDMPLIPQEIIETAVIRECVEHILDLTRLEEVRKILTAEQQERLPSLQQERTALINRHNSISQQIANLTNAIAEQGHTRAMLDRLALLEQEQGGIILQLAGINDQIQHAAGLDKDDLAGLIANIRPALLSADRKNIREILHSFIDKIVIDRDEKTILGQIRFFIPDRLDGYAYKTSHRPIPLYTHNFSFSYSFDFHGNAKITPVSNAISSRKIAQNAS